MKDDFLDAVDEILEMTDDDLDLLSPAELVRVIRICRKALGGDDEKQPSLLTCRCGRTPKVVQWGDTLNPNATWIECDCGMMTDSVHCDDPDVAIEMAAEIWNGGKTWCKVT